MRRWTKIEAVPVERFVLEWLCTKWNESGFRPPLCIYRLNWARTSWGRWDDWDDTALQTQDSKFEPWRSEAEHATSRSRRLPTILTFTRGWGRNIFVSFKLPRPGTEHRTLAWKAAVLTTTLGPPPGYAQTSLISPKETEWMCDFNWPGAGSVTDQNASPSQHSFLGWGRNLNALYMSWCWAHVTSPNICHVAKDCDVYYPQWRRQKWNVSALGGLLLKSRFRGKNRDKNDGITTVYVIFYMALFIFLNSQLIFQLCRSSNIAIIAYIIDYIPHKLCLFTFSSKNKMADNHGVLLWSVHLITLILLNKICSNCGCPLSNILHVFT